MIKSELSIQQQIILLRGKQTLLDRDLAKIYQVDTKVLNQAVKRNIDRFPKEFRFQLNKDEIQELVTNCDRFNSLKHSINLPYAFTEYGVAMLSAVLRSTIAVQVSIQIMKAFVVMRHILLTNQELQNRIATIELKQQCIDDKINELFDAWNKNELLPKYGIFYDGEIFDAYKFALDIIKSAKQSIILIDNYVDENTLIMLANRTEIVKARIFTTLVSDKLNLTLKKHQEQYPKIEIALIKNCHDRFLIVDEKELYHLGASLKDLGKKWFAFSKMNDLLPELLLRLK
jgi:hypothetical protein